MRPNLDARKRSAYALRRLTNSLAAGSKWIFEPGSTVKNLLTPSQIAEKLGLSVRTVQAMMHDGRLPCYSVTGNRNRKRYRMSEEQLQNYLDGNWVRPREEHVDRPRVARAGFPMMEKYGYR